MKPSLIRLFDYWSKRFIVYVLFYNIVKAYDFRTNRPIVFVFSYYHSRQDFRQQFFEKKGELLKQLCNNLMAIPYDTRR